MDDKITIIEGPPPTFEESREGWALGLNEGPFVYDMVLTRLRTFNGPALVERCHHTWSKQATMFLHYRDNLGMEEKVPILAARTVETTDGNLLLLWVRVKSEETKQQVDIDDDEDSKQ